MVRGVTAVLRFFTGFHCRHTNPSTPTEEPTISRKIKNDKDAKLRDKQILVIGDGGERLGVMSVRDGLAKADEAGLDLVAVAEKGKQPVCKLMDYGRYRYKEKQKKRQQHHQKNKEVKFRVNTEKHDYDLKLQRVLEFLEKGHKVRLSLQFRGREMAHRELGMERLQEVIADIGDRAQVESEPRISGRICSAQLAPLSKK